MASHMHYRTLDQEPLRPIKVASPVMSMATRIEMLLMSTSLPGARAVILATVSSRMRRAAGKPFLQGIRRIRDVQLGNCCLCRP